MTKGRLEAFSDGVIAIIITIMVFKFLKTDINLVFQLPSSYTIKVPNS